MKFYLVGYWILFISIHSQILLWDVVRLPRNSTMLGLRFVIWEQSSNSSRDSFSSSMRRVFLEAFKWPLGTGTMPGFIYIL